MCSAEIQWKKTKYLESNNVTLIVLHKLKFEIIINTTQHHQR